MTKEPESRRSARAALGRAVCSAGPGIVFMLAVVGPQDLVSNSAMGASYGYSALWTLALILAVRYVILESSSRYVLVTGENLLTGYGRVGRWVVWLIFGSLLLKRHLSNLFQLLLLGNFAHLVAPLPTAASAKIWSASLWIAGFLLMYKGRYGLIERISKPLVTLLGGTLLAVALLARPDPGAVLRGFFIPTIPADQGAYTFVFLLMALAGSTAGSIGSLKYAVFVHEKGWRERSLLKRQRLDLLISVVGLFAMAALMQIAAAAVLRPQRGQVVEVEDLVPLFSSSLGAVGRVVLGLGIWAALFNTYLGSNTGYSLMVSQMYYGVLRPSHDAAVGGAADASHSHRPAYRRCLVWFCLSPVYVLFTDWKPVLLTLFTTALFVILVPVVVLALLRLTNDKKLMGEYVNGWVTNLALLFAAAAACYLTYQNAADFWTRHLSVLFN
jgi:Mn2+/Fe2+ NRAMP family transporter